MGEAKRRRLAGGAVNDAGAVIDRAKLARAMRIALSPIGQDLGTECADCVRYAGVGAEVLRQLGATARLQVGDAVWRVGPGDGDVIHHAASAGGPTFGPLFSVAFHAWLRIDQGDATPAQLVDFTTWQLRDKGKLLDAADGRRTHVAWCPDYLWVAEKEACRRTLRQVGDSYEVGVYGYAARPVPAKLGMPSAALTGMLAQVVLFCYGELLADHELVASIQDAAAVQGAEVVD